MILQPKAATAHWAALTEEGSGVAFIVDLAHVDGLHAMWGCGARGTALETALAKSKKWMVLGWWGVGGEL